MRRPLGDDDFIIVRVVVGLLILLAFLIFFSLFINQYVQAAYNASQWVTKSQVQKAEELGAIQRTELEVVNNYGTQSTYNPQQAGENR